MKLLVLRAWMFLLLLPGAVVPLVQSAEISEADATAIRTVIEAQLAAFAADDEAKAFSFASSTIREMFQTPQNFIAMVRDSYPVVYRPASVLFLEPEAAGENDVEQQVQMSDSDGQFWMAIYRMQHQPDGSWLINGCMLARTKGALT